MPVSYHGTLKQRNDLEADGPIVRASVSLEDNRIDAVLRHQPTSETEICGCDG